MKNLRTHIMQSMLILLSIPIGIYASNSFNSNGFAVTLTTSNSWSTGANAKLTIQNNSGNAVSSWIVDFDFTSADQSCGSVWDGIKTAKTTGNHVQIQNASYNGSLANGASASPGMTLKFANGTTPGITNVIVTVNGMPTSSQTNLPVNPPVSTLPVTPPTPTTPVVSTPSPNTCLCPCACSTAGSIPNPTQSVTPVTPPTATNPAPITTNPVITPVNPPATPITPPAPINTSSNSSASQYKVVGYFPNWLVYNVDTKNNKPYFSASQIDLATSKLTHVYYAFAKPYTLPSDPDTLANMDQSGDKALFCGNFLSSVFGSKSYYPGCGEAGSNKVCQVKNYKISVEDAQSDICGSVDPSTNKSYPGNYIALQQLKAQNPGLKTVLSVGGWSIYKQGFPAAQYSAMISNAASRADFINSAILFAQKYNFDGIDIDFEYPGFAANGGNPATDKANFTTFLQEFRAAINTTAQQNNSTPLLLTMAAPAGLANIANTDYANIHQYLDWINLMGYDFNGQWSSITGHNAPLTAPMYNGKSYGDGLTGTGTPTFYVDAAIQKYLSLGVPANKIVLGMPLYGRTFAGAANTQTVQGLPGLYTSFNRNISGSNVPADGPGYQSWPNIQSTLLDATQMNGLNGYTRYWDSVAQVPYLFNPSYTNPNNNNTVMTDLITYDDDQSLGIKAQYVKTNKLGGAMFWQLENHPAIWQSIGKVATTLNS